MFQLDSNSQNWSNNREGDRRPETSIFSMARHERASCEYVGEPLKCNVRHSNVNTFEEYRNERLRIRTRYQSKIC